MHHLTFPSFFLTRTGVDAHSEFDGCIIPAFSTFSLDAPPPGVEIKVAFDAFCA